MSDFELVPDKKFPNAVTLHTPEKKKIRISEYKDGRLRIRLAKAGPMLVQECYLTGVGEDVILSLVPEGWKRGASEGSEGAASGRRPKVFIPASDLAKAGVTLLDGADFRLSCNACRNEWAPVILPGGGVSPNYWHCPNACNVLKV